MTRLAAALAALALAGGAAHAQAAGEAFAFAVMGDTPYNAAEEKAFLAMLGRTAGEALAFVVHVGDFKGGGACSDALFERRRAQFDASAHPFVFVPGDNDWVDCPGAEPRERLARLRALFFAEPTSLGRRRMPMEAQAQCLAPEVPGCGCASHPENRSWEVSGVRFVTLNIPGSANNHADPGEARCRDEANRRWLARAAGAAERAHALVVLVQANPWDTTRPAYDGFLAQLEQAARRLARPVLLVHGDTHTYRIDFPFVHVTRLETYGSPFVGWVKVSVDPASASPFAFEPRREAFVMPR